MQSDDAHFFPDFHNLPFYYGNDFHAYMDSILAHLNGNGFPAWEGHMSPLPWTQFKPFVDCLSKKALNI
jgi:hypothetical protein